MAKTTTKAEPSRQAKKSKSVVGAPSQLSQNTRKGKKAWRKNIDIDNVWKGVSKLFGPRSPSWERRCTTNPIKTCLLSIPLAMKEVCTP